MSKEGTIILVIAVYAVIMLLIGFLSSRKSSGMADFTVGGRNAGAWISALSYGTAYFSAVMFIGYSGGSGWSFGLWSVLIGVGNAAIGALFAWLVLAKRTREVTRRLKIKSMPQLFEMRYNSTGMKYFSCAVIFLFLLPYSASVYKGLTSVCSVLLGINETVCMIVIAVAAAAVLFLGGYLATLKADFVQGFVMIFGIIALICTVLGSSQVGGLQSGVSRMLDYMRENKIASLSGSSAVSFVSTLLMTSFGTWGLPQMVHKYYGIRDDKEVKRGTVISTVFCLLVAGGGYFIGSFSHLFFSEMPAGGKDYLIPNMLDSAGIPYILIGLVLILLISASVSTLASITLTACSTVSMDLVKAKIKPKMRDKNLALLTKILCVVFVGASYLVANYPTPILEMMSYSWGIISGAFLAPYLLSLYWKGVNRAGAWAGMLGGFLTAFLPAAISKFTTPQGPFFACLAICISFFLCITVSLVFGKLKLKGGEENSFFYTGTAEEWRKEHGIIKYE